MSNFNIFVTYGDHTKLFSCSSRREFGSKVARFFGLDRSEMQLLEVSRGSRNPITINDLKDKMKLELRKNGIKSTSETNGERPERTRFESVNIPDVAEQLTDQDPVKVPDIVELKRKLTENRVLSGPERKFLLHVVDEFSDSIASTSRKRKRGPEEAVEKVNKKLQATPQITSTYTQTDQGIFNNPPEPSTSKDLITESKRLARSEKKDAVKVRSLMDKTFEERRHFILLKNPILHLVKEKYPLLFSTDEVINELNRIFYDKKAEEFLSNIKKYSTTIINLVEENHPLAKTIKEANDKASTVSQKSYARQVGSLLAISNVVRERRTFLHTEDEPCEKNNYPRIEAPCEVSEIFEDVITYKIIVEGLILCEASNFPEAILCLLSSYFIFNISYPEQSFNTFVLMEKIFLDANDTDVNDVDEDTNQFIRYIKLKTNQKS
ncbi:uncharacterized protein [Parasteatoda tepidariorum]|uniref:uncharacterized protein n=1 Tax=Parasteatoda tepidariorum TaxID=114398 RepID=UPI001C71AB50|nr:uncharacterized protein LOC107443655 [Parasteatoda tepidariorum]XP_021003126.2 uncharacterized protein LOC107443655 [Parasteatoda tepidariorum]